MGKTQQEAREDGGGQHRDRRRDEQTDPQRERAHHDRELQPDQCEDQRLQQRVERLPYRLVLQAGGEAALGRLVPEVEPGDDHGEHPGGVQLLGEEVGHERDDEPDRALQHRVAEHQTHPVHQPADERADDHPTDRGERELAEPTQHRRPGADRRGEHDPEQGEGGGVVEQALALEDRHHAALQAEAPADGRGGDRVGWGDDGAEHEGAGQGQVGNDQPRGDPDDGGGEHDEPHGQQQDGTHVLPDAQRRALQRRRVQQGREDEEQDQLGLQRHGGQTRDEREAEPDDDEHQGRRDVHPPRHGGHRERDDEDDEQCERAHGVSGSSRVVWTLTA